MTAITRVAVTKTPQPARPSTAVFIDGANLYFSTYYGGYTIDFDRLKKLIISTCPEDEKVSLYYVSATWTPFHDPDVKHPYGRHNQLEFLRQLGYTVITKDIEVGPKGKPKSNMDIEIATAMLASLIDGCRTMILLSADGGFQPVIEELEQRGAQVIVVAAYHSMANSYRGWLGNRYVPLKKVIVELEAMQWEVQSEKEPA